MITEAKYQKSLTNPSENFAINIVMDGEKLHVPVSCNGKDYMWTCNNTTRTFLVDNFGTDETAWIGKTIDIEIVKTQTSNGLMDAMYPKGALD